MAKKISLKKKYVNIVNSKKENLRQFGHTLAAFIILVHAYERYDEHKASYVWFLVLGILFLFVAVIHKKVLQFHNYADSTFLIIEAVAIGLIAFDFFRAGKKALPICYACAAIGYVVVAVIKYRKNKSYHTKNGIL